VLDKKTGSNLIQWPVKEVERLRVKRYKFHNEKVMPGSVVSLDIGTATQVCVACCLLRFSNYKVHPFFVHLCDS
jgi:hypothetical protein